ncbi:transcriptional regulator [Advenella mandrilli]|nr:transcriptional regulator [Advenella mandrilli]
MRKDTQCASVVPLTGLQVSSLKKIEKHTSLTYNKTMIYTVYETSIFIKTIADIWSDDERHEFIKWIACNPEAGDVIPGSGGLRKVRWGKQGIGKRGGVRIIYFNTLSVGEISLLIAYTKAKFDNLSTEFLLNLKNEVSK